jgi:hypothetical protein
MILSDEYVSSRLAVELSSEMGYDEPTDHFYEIQGNGTYTFHAGENDNWNQYLCKVSAPTIYEVMRWFRERWNVNVIIDGSYVDGWMFSIYIIGKPKALKTGVGSSYLSAANDAIAAVIEIVETNTLNRNHESVRDRRNLQGNWIFDEY